MPAPWPVDAPPRAPPLQGANQAAAAAKLGYPTYFLGQVCGWLCAVTLRMVPCIDTWC